MAAVRTCGLIPGGRATAIGSVFPMRRARDLTAGLTAVLAIALLAAGCGSSSKDSGAAASSTTTTAAVATQNACPAEGCVVTITDVKKEGSELRVTWTANYAPDLVTSKSVASPEAMGSERSAFAICQ